MGSYLLLIIVSLVLGLGTQAYINSSYRKWSKVSISTGLTGAETARRMLDSSGLSNVSIERVGGELTDHFDPTANVLRLSDDVYSGRTVAASAIACHEAGHAIQHAKGYIPAKIRMTLVPVANFGSNAWIFIMLVGVFLNLIGLVYLAIAFYAFAVLFQIVTLPVEFDASKRALASISSSGAIPASQLGGAKTVLTSAALTYVAAALVSIMQLLYLLGQTRD